VLSSILITLIIFLLVYVSMTVRVHRIESARTRRKSYDEIPSPLGEAIKDFVAVAGGVYLGLMALSEFLKVPAPIRAELWGVAFDPVAVVAVALAIVTPLFPARGRQ
jgi:sterol desaturase/sphingolipid hydroxylase (fatty acid hydroxylase superfamily)